MYQLAILAMSIVSVLLTQGPICEILATIAQILGVAEILGFFESAIFQKKIFLLHSYLN